MNTVFETPVLNARNSYGRMKYWKGKVITDPDAEGDTHYTQTESWQELKSGGESKRRISDPSEVEPTNVGRSNERGSKDQAVFEIESAADRKRDKGYWNKGEPEPDKLPLPMLAHRYDKRSHDIEYPAYVQPKLDGMRMLFAGQKGWSRKGKEVIDEVIQHIKISLPEDTILDGELMIPHEDATFQETIKAIKKYREGVSEDLQFFVYDILKEDDTSFYSRLKELEAMFEGENSQGVFKGADGQRTDNIRFVPTLSVKSEEEMRSMHSTFLQQGFEGTMVRNAKGPYKLKNRSKHLQKVKDFKDAEFEIVGFTDGYGREDGKIIFLARSTHHDGSSKELPKREVLEAMSDSERRSYGVFTTRPKGSMEKRSEWYDDGDSFIGKELTVRYQELSDDGLPRFPVGISARDYE